MIMTLIYCNQQLVLQTSSTAAASKKPTRSEGLPDWVNPTWFRYTFVTTYMSFVGQTTNPWDVPVKQAVVVMQKIWDAISHQPYEITSSSVLYRKVCHGLSSRMISKHFSDNSTPRGLMAQYRWIYWHLSHLSIL